MKKFKIWGSLLLSMLLFVSCDADRDSNPVINTDQAPSSFTLNNPVQSAQYIDLEKNAIYLTWSQPDFGYNAIATYKVQVGVVQADGSIKWNMKTTTDEAGNIISQEPEYVISTYNTCKAEVSGKNIAMEINQIDGMQEIDDWEKMGLDKLGYREIAVRIHASINISSSEEVKGTSVYSNAVTFKYMNSYKVIKLPATLYITGSPNSWLPPQAKNEEKFLEGGWAITETEIGSNIFNGVVKFEAGNLQFRFYAALTDWDGGDSWGPQEDDSGVEVGFDDDGVFPNSEFTEAAIVKGKGSWLFKSFDGGKVDLTVDMNAKTVKFVRVEDEEL